MLIDATTIGGVVAAGFVGWILYAAWPARIVVNDQWLIKKQRLRRETMLVSDLVQIKFHYHAVVGFVATWEFISKSGQAMLAEANSIDDKLLAKLERHVPNFSSKRFYAAFHDGDVEDTIEVWHVE